MYRRTKKTCIEIPPFWTSTMNAAILNQYDECRHFEQKTYFICLQSYIDFLLSKQKSTLPQFWINET